MPVLEINGRKVEVDDSFLDLSPQEQEAQVDEIAASLPPAPKASSGPAGRAIGPQVDPAPAAQHGDQFIPYIPDATSSPGQDPASDAWIAEQERKFQQEQQGGQRTPTDTGAPPPAEKDRGSFLNSAFLGLGDALSFGTIDEITAGLGTVLPGSKTSVWDGKNLSDAYNENVADERRKLKEAFDNHPIGFIGGGIAGGLIPVAGAANAARAAKGTTKLGSMMAAGTGYGAAYGFGSDEGGISDRLDGTALGAAGGAVGGAVLHGAGKGIAKVAEPLIDKALPKVAKARFLAEQAKNPHAATDGEIATDLDRIVRTIQTGKAKRKLQDATLSNRVSELEASYLPRAEIQSLDLTPSVKARLKLAMDRRHILSDDEVSALRDGSPAGEAVANAIEKTRRLKALVPDGAETRGSMKKVLAEAAGSAAGYKVAGPLGGAVGSIAGRMASGGASRDTAAAARALASQAPKFAQLPELAAAAGNRAKARDALAKLSDEARDAPFFAKREADAVKAQAANDAERMAQEGRKIGIANARDDIVGDGGFRAFAYERTGLLPSQQDAGALRLLKDGTISPEQFNAFLAEPDRLMAGNAGNAIVDRLASMAEKGALNRDPKWEPKSRVPAAAGEPPAIYSSPDVASRPSVAGGEGMAVDIGAAASPSWKSTDQGITEPQRNFAKAYEAWSDELDKANPDRATVEALYAAKEQAGRMLDADIFRQSQQAPSPIRNVEAYRATAAANQVRVSSAIDAVRSDSSLDDGAKNIISTAVASIGNTSSRDKAQGIATDALDQLPEGLRDKARATLQPLVAQIKR
ncbi:hypothetical protein [Sphingobium estronivorans]|uniref:hypothetical protein n=1 Tax=Sphingobium estronivorans TaxID=1577690 RepID=UPI001238AC14|nr:hypothetical protein [Sphingobium estronivorans]